MNKLSNLFLKAKQIFLRYPMILSIALLLGISAILIVDISDRERGFLVSKISLTLALGISLFFGIKMLSQRISYLIPLQIGGLVILGLFYYALPENSMFKVENYWIVPCFILSHLFVAFIPFINKKNEIHFWEYNKNLFIYFLLTILFSGVLIGGIELAILALDKLFNLDINQKIYTRFFIFLITFGSCFIFLMFINKGLYCLEKKGTYPIVLKFFTQFILIPLLFIYLIILYVYSIKILINWELPRGWVSYLILAYSLVGILALLLVHPLKEVASKSWVKVFSKAFYYTLIPLLILLYVAIFTRILAYGYTEPRYFIVIISIWLTSVVLYFIIFKNPTIKYI